ncbi:hypothetical protein [Shimia sagamensis]|uniref:hypothetical protein n=1 Tax=Shimia sagamensis TaxID=1566352 RepID=UPI0024B6D782|nr:hypothetical protein [Shimia sagamensis]
MPSARFLLAVVALVLIASGISGWQGFRAGKAACESANAAALRDTQTDLFDAADQLSVTNARLVAQEVAQKAKSEGIENEARDDQAPSRVPSDVSLRRLQRRWGSTY